MKITIGSTELVSGQARNSTGSPVGPDKLTVNDSPGVVRREFIGKTRIEPEDVRPHSGTVSFDAHRTFATVDAALAYVGGTMLAEETQGAFKIGSNTVFAKATVTDRRAALVGCTVVVSYTIEG